MPRLVDGQRLNFAGKPCGLVSHDPLDRFQPVLDGADLGPELGILVGQELDPLDCFLVIMGKKRLTPGTVERIAMPITSTIGTIGRSS